MTGQGKRLIIIWDQDAEQNGFVIAEVADDAPRFLSYVEAKAELVRKEAGHEHG